MADGVLACGFVNLTVAGQGVRCVFVSGLEVLSEAWVAG